MNNMLYELDQAMLSYLSTVLEKEVGEPFRCWAKACGESNQYAKELTREMGQEALCCPVEEIELQEQLVPCGIIYPERNKAWEELLKQVTPIQKTLCELYADVLADLSDIENMELAISIAEESGNEAHFKRVKEVLDLDEIVEPTWWQG